MHCKSNVWRFVIWTELGKNGQIYLQKYKNIEYFDNYKFPKIVPSKIDQIGFEGTSMYSWIERQLDIGTSLGRRRNYVQFQIRGHFWIPQPKLH